MSSDAESLTRLDHVGRRRRPSDASVGTSSSTSPCVALLPGPEGRALARELPSGEMPWSMMRGVSGTPERGWGAHEGASSHGASCQRRCCRSASHAARGRRCASRRPFASQAKTFRSQADTGAGARVSNRPSCPRVVKRDASQPDRTSMRWAVTAQRFPRFGI